MGINLNGQSLNPGDEDIDGDMDHRVQADWCKRRVATGVLCYVRFPDRLKGEIYRVTVYPAKLHGSDYLSLRKQK